VLHESGRGQVLLDCGGQEGPLAPALLAALAVLSPNETELARLTGASRLLISERGRCHGVLHLRIERLCWWLGCESVGALSRHWQRFARSPTWQVACVLCSAGEARVPL